MVGDLLAEAEQSLSAIDNARLDAEVLLATSMNTDRASLYAYPERLVDEDVIKDFKRLVSKRKQQYPLAYLLGKKEFWSLELEVNQHTLIPRPETECLVETALSMLPQDQTLDVLDLGTGSGAIALALAIKVKEGKITKSSRPTPTATRATCSPAVPDDVATAASAPVAALTMPSNWSTNGPIDDT